MTSGSEIVKVKESGAVWREIDGETIVLNIETSLYLGVNKTGTLLWPAMVEGATRADLTALPVASTNLDETRAAADVDAFVEACRQHGVLEG